MAERPTELLLLSVSDLNRMRLEFIEAYNQLMESACQRLEFSLLIKLECMNFCEKVEEEKMNMQSSIKQMLTMRKKCQNR